MCKILVLKEFKLLFFFGFGIVITLPFLSSLPNPPIYYSHFLIYIYVLEREIDRDTHTHIYNF